METDQNPVYVSKKSNKQTNKNNIKMYQPKFLYPIISNKLHFSSRQLKNEFKLALSLNYYFELVFISN